MNSPGSGGDSDEVQCSDSLWQDRPAAENMEVAVNADRLGYPELWIGEMATFDAFALATAVGGHTRQIALSIGPLAVSVRTPVTAAMGIASVAALTGRRVALALGASSTVVVEQWHGCPRSRTASHLDETAQIVQACWPATRLISAVSWPVAGLPLAAGRREQSADRGRIRAGGGTRITRGGRSVCC